MTTYFANNDLAESIVLEVKDFAKRDAAGPRSTAEIEVCWGDIIPFTVIVPKPLMAKDAGL